MTVDGGSMMRVSRRDFLRTGSAGLVCAAGTRLAWGRGLGVPLGLQLYSVRDLLPKDYEGTLKQVGALGYQEVEAAGFFHHTPAEVTAAMQGAGLRCVSGHYPSDELHKRFDEIVAFHKEIGAHYIICASPGYKNPPAAGGGARGVRTLEDWRWNAEEFNKWGQTAKAAGLQFGYHNHTPEFARTEGMVPYDELLRMTDPALVTFEMDAGWVKVAGADPVAYLGKYPDRISMLHLKDFKPLAAGAGPETRPTPAELGQGTMDMAAVVRAATPGKIKHVFVEQEGFDMPPFESLKVDAAYVRPLLG